MGHVQWIKVCTDIFDNEKMKKLLRNRDGDAYFRVWIQMLTLAKNDNIRMYEKSKITMYKHTFFFVYFFTGGIQNGKINSSIKDIERNESKAKLFSIS